MAEADKTHPQVIVLAGPNGAGKSTAASALLPEGMAFVNADEVAKGLAEYPSPSADWEAGRIVLEQMDDLERQRADFAEETTLSGRGLARRIARLKREGYHFWLVFVWAPSAEFCIQRVASRVRAGGHDIPKESIRRRYTAGIKNFFNVYHPLADRWGVYDATQFGTPRPIASDTMNMVTQIEDKEIWQRMKEIHDG